MRLSNLSFFIQALLLTAVAAQSTGVSNPVQDITTDSTSSSSTSMSETTSSTTSSTSSTETSKETTSTVDPTTSSTSSSTTTDPVIADPTTSAEPSSTPEPTVTSTTSKKTDPASKTSTEGDNTTTFKTSTTQTPVVKTITSYATSDGSTIANVMTTTSIPSPSLNGDKSSGSSGVSASDKKIIIGVVVGVGGAILIGAVGLVFWRIHKKRSEQYGDEDDLMGGTAVGSGPREKAPSPAGNTPFKNTLDQYHNPGPVNAASNF
ncbi:Mid2-like cell wall stress sensor [Penicillium fimorum]|uniref:Mid2-like cell wall stress sensor n=1 Tax=Penicillium fimorum TaxID=1882269 RepID=A0A9W9Y322_9EURO|nr:Mid2-like cell wall stress sensor [Penicillium fimorum]